MSKNGELVAKRLRCKHHREQVKKIFDKDLKEGRISQSLYDKCIQDLNRYKKNELLSI